MVHKNKVFQMLSEVPRVISATVCIAIIAWHSCYYVRQFGWGVAKRAFLLRYSALLKSPQRDSQLADGVNYGSQSGK